MTLYKAQTRVYLGAGKLERWHMGTLDDFHRSVQSDKRSIGLLNEYAHSGKAKILKAKESANDIDSGVLFSIKSAVELLAISFKNHGLEMDFGGPMNSPGHSTSKKHVPTVLERISLWRVDETAHAVEEKSLPT